MGNQCGSIRTSMCAPVTPVLPTSRPIANPWARHALFPYLRTPGCRSGWIFPDRTLLLDAATRGCSCSLITSQSKFILRPRRDNPLSAEVCANLFFSTVVKHHGLPDILVSDRGSQWLSEFWRKLFKHCGTNLRFSTAYHPETDGLSERTIRTVIDTLRCCLDGTHEAWDEHLDAIELALNSSVSASTGLAPFEIVYGNNARLPLSLPTACDPATSFLSRRETARLRAADAIQEAQLRQAAQINKHRRPADMTIGDLVWLSTKI